MAEDPRWNLPHTEWPVGLPSAPDTHSGRTEWALWQEREKINAACTFAEGKAISAKARGDYDRQRDWLDLLILLGAS